MLPVGSSSESRILCHSSGRDSIDVMNACSRSDITAGTEDISVGGIVPASASTSLRCFFESWSLSRLLVVSYSFIKFR